MPASIQASSRSRRTDSGFASSVRSASGAMRKREARLRHRVRNWRALSAEGVPPPKNTEVNVMPSACGARRSASRAIAAR